MANEIAIIEKGRFLALQEGSEIAEAIKCNMAGEGIEESDLTRVPTPAGGGTSWTIAELSGEQTTKTIEGLLVFMQPRGTLWPSEEPTDSPPYLVSNDLLVARKCGDDAGDLDVAALEKCRMPENGDLYDWRKIAGEGGIYGFGTSKNGVGKRAKESRVLFVLRDTDAFPLVIQAQVGSLRSIKPFIKKLPVPHFRAIIELALEKAKNGAGQEYARIVPRLVGTIDREAGEIVRTLYTEPLSRLARHMELAAEVSTEEV